MTHAEAMERRIVEVGKEERARRGPFYMWNMGACKDMKEARVDGTLFSRAEEEARLPFVVVREANRMCNMCIHYGDQREA